MRNLTDRLRPRRVNPVGLSLIIASAGAGIIIGGSMFTAHSLSASAPVSPQQGGTQTLTTTATQSAAPTLGSTAVPAAGDDHGVETPDSDDNGAVETPDADDSSAGTASAHDDHDDGPTAASTPQAFDDHGGLRPTPSPSASFDDHGGSGGGHGGGS